MGCKQRHTPWLYISFHSTELCCCYSVVFLVDSFIFGHIICSSFVRFCWMFAVCVYLSSFFWMACRYIAAVSLFILSFCILYVAVLLKKISPLKSGKCGNSDNCLHSHKKNTNANSNVDELQKTRRISHWRPNSKEKMASVHHSKCVRYLRCNRSEYSHCFVFFVRSLFLSFIFILISCFVSFSHFYVYLAMHTSNEAIPFSIEWSGKDVERW